MKAIPGARKVETVIGSSPTKILYIVHAVEKGSKRLPERDLSFNLLHALGTTPLSGANFVLGEAHVRCYTCEMLLNLHKYHMHDTGAKQVDQKNL